MQLFFDILLFAFALSMFIAAISLAPWVPSLPRDLQRALDLANVKPGERFYDIGCGDGRTVVHAAKHFGAKATGIELAFPMYIAAKIRVLLSRQQEKANISFGNLFKHNLSDADVIYVYGMPTELAGRLRKKLESECKPGTRIISYFFEIRGWDPVALDCRMTGTPRKDVYIRLYVL